MVETLAVEVVYAEGGRQDVARLELAAGSTIEQAIRASGLLERHADIDLASNQVGIFGKAASLASPLRDQDRVEIYRPLAADPKEMRRRRAGRAVR